MKGSDDDDFSSSSSSTESNNLPKRYTSTTIPNPNGTKPLRLLVCSANLGNTKPTNDSIAALLPQDGMVSELLENANYPLSVTTATTTKISGTNGDNTTEPPRITTKDDRFDIIAIGLQEATFIPWGGGGGGVGTTTTNDTSPIGDDTIHQNELPPDDEELQNIKTEETIKVPQNTSALTVRNNNSAENVLDTLKGYMINLAADIYGGKVLRQMITSRCGSLYDCPIDYRRGEMRLFVFVKKNLMDDLEELDVHSEDIGSHTGSSKKGGIVASITLLKTRLSFITVHLQAHEGPNNYLRRCENLATILNNAKVGRPTTTSNNKNKQRRFDASITSHHCFVFGDLNFRVMLPDFRIRQDRITDTLYLVSQRKWKALYDADELAKAIQLKDCLVEFRTLPCHFPPTFKVKRAKGFVYNEMRTPSYTDRILWKSADGLKNNIIPLLYEPCGSFETSDHKPIRGAFSVIAVGCSKMNERGCSCSSNTSTTTSTGLVVPSKFLSPKLNLFVSDIQCFLLHKCNPYVMIVTDPTELLSQSPPPSRSNSFYETFLQRNSKGDERRHNSNQTSPCGFPCTGIKMKSFNPNWTEETIDLELETTSSSNGGIQCLAGAMLHISVMDFRIEEDDDALVGTVSLNLRNLFSEECHHDGSMDVSLFGPYKGHIETTNVEKRLLKGGEVCGTLKCCIFSWWVVDLE